MLLQDQAAESTSFYIVVVIVERNTLCVPVVPEVRKRNNPMPHYYHHINMAGPNQQVGRIFSLREAFLYSPQKEGPCGSLISLLPSVTAIITPLSMRI